MVMHTPNFARIILLRAQFPSKFCTQKFPVRRILLTITKFCAQNFPVCRILLHAQPTTKFCVQNFLVCRILLRAQPTWPNLRAQFSCAHNPHPHKLLTKLARNSPVVHAGELCAQVWSILYSRLRNRLHFPARCEIFSAPLLAAALPK